MFLIINYLSHWSHMSKIELSSPKNWLFIIFKIFVCSDRRQKCNFVFNYSQNSVGQLVQQLIYYSS